MLWFDVKARGLWYHNRDSIASWLSRSEICGGTGVRPRLLSSRKRPSHDESRTSILKSWYKNRNRKIDEQINENGHKIGRQYTIVHGCTCTSTVTVVKYIIYYIYISFLFLSRVHQSNLESEKWVLVVWLSKPNNLMVIHRNSFDFCDADVEKAFVLLLTIYQTCPTPFFWVRPCVLDMCLRNPNSKTQI